MTLKVTDQSTRRPFRRHHSPPEWLTQERQTLQRQLRDDGCLVCRAMTEAERNWRHEYVRESYSEPDVRRRVAANAGFCATHLRALIADDDGWHVLPIMLGDVIADVLRRPAGTVIRTACEVCARQSSAEQSRLDLLRRWLTDPEVFDALADQGQFCLPHLTALVGTAPEPITDRLAALAKRHIGAIDLHAPIARTTGPERGLHHRTDALRIAQQAGAGADIRATDQATLEHVMTGLTRSCCLVCRTSAQAEVGYLAWLSHQSIGDLDRTEAALCAHHLQDLSILADDGAVAAAAVVRDIELNRLDRLLDQLAHAPDRHPWQRLRTAVSLTLSHRYTDATAALRSRRTFVSDVTTTYRTTAPNCPACTAGRTAERRELALLAAVLPHRAVRNAWERGHGLCITHAPQLADQLPQDVLHSRLRLLAWELAEQVRKQAWQTRHEGPTATDTAWQRAIPLLCGAAYLGCTTDEIGSDRWDR